MDYIVCGPLEEKESGKKMDSPVTLLASRRQQPPEIDPPEAPLSTTPRPGITCDPWIIPFQVCPTVSAAIHSNCSLGALAL